VHLASVWVPFTSEAKEAVAHYDELLEEMKSALRECGRKLASHVRSRKHADREMKRRSLFEKYIPEVAAAIGGILGMESGKVEKPFYATLPDFVKFADEEPVQAPKDDKGGGSPPPEGSSPPDEAPPPPPKDGAPGGKGSKGSKGKKSAELTLVE